MSKSFHHFVWHFIIVKSEQCLKHLKGNAKDLLICQIKAADSALTPLVQVISFSLLKASTHEGLFMWLISSPCCQRVPYMPVRCRFLWQTKQSEKGTHWNDSPRQMMQWQSNSLGENLRPGACGSWRFQSSWHDQITKFVILLLHICIVWHM